METISWSRIAWEIARDAARAEPSTRRRWAGQNEWDAEHMHTESTRFPRCWDEELRRCCREAGVTRYALISYLLRAWMAAWEVYSRSLPDADSTGHPLL